MDDCPFCLEKTQARVVLEEGTVWAIPDLYPVTPGHHLVVPRRHVPSYFEMTEEERCDADRLLVRLREQILASDRTVQGFNIGMNCGPVAGQTVAHAHIHLIPRREGDVDNPRGGVRGCVPEKMNY